MVGPVSYTHLDVYKRQEEKAMQNLALIRKICYNLMKLDTRFDKKKKMTYKKMSMLYTYHLDVYKRQNKGRTGNPLKNIYNRLYRLINPTSKITR